MRIDSIAYISREIGNAAVFSAPNFSSLSESLENDVKVATKIIIVSGYFGTDYILDLLEKPTKQRRKKCIVQLILGYDKQTEFIYGKIKIEDLQKQVFALGYTKKRVTVRLFRDSAPLHTKLYGFLRTTRPVWYVGSANASDAIKGKRHELMIRLPSKFAALEKYVETLLKHQTKANKVFDGDNLSIQEYLSKGFLIFKPSRNKRFTYDAFSISPEERKKISKQWGLDSRVPHADPDAEGFGFNLVSALGLSLEKKQGKTTKVHFRQFCVETAYGYWAPQEYIEKINNAVTKSMKNEESVLEQISEALITKSESELLQEFLSYKKSAEMFFNNLSVKAIPKKNLESSFSKFLKIRRAWLNDKEWIQRASSKITISQMPDIWSDETASEKFISSFVDDLVAVLNAPGKNSRIYKDLKETLSIPDFPDIETVREKLSNLKGLV